MSAVGSVGGRAGAAPAIRRAAPGDAAALSALALRSKAVWGYDPAFIEACREELTITPAEIAAQPAWVLEEQGAIRGFCQLRIAGRTAEIARFFIDPARLRAGLGRRLWAHLEIRARAAGCYRLEVDSDPHVEGFYRAMGTSRCGTAPSGSIPGRALPHLHKQVSAPAAG